MRLNLVKTLSIFVIVITFPHSQQLENKCLTLSESMKLVDKLVISKLENSIVYIFILISDFCIFMWIYFLLLLRISIIKPSYVNTSVYCMNPIYSAHSGDKPHKCSVCDKVLENSDILYVNHYYAYIDNIFYHTEEKPTECDICDKVFVNSIIIAIEKNTTLCDINANNTSHKE